MKHLLPLVISIFFYSCTAQSTDIDKHWPQWRGPSGSGEYHGSGLPLSWSEESGILWKCESGPGNSTPIIWGDAVFLTSEHDQDLLLSRIDKSTGKIVWTRKVGEAGNQLKHHAPHGDYNLATPSPVTNGKVIIAHFGNGDLAAYDFKGNQVWKRNLQEDNGVYTTKFGHSNSSVIHEDKVISICIQDNLIESQPDNLSESYIVAHNIKTGREIWKTLRMPDVEGEPCDSYVTPVLRTYDGKTEIIVMGAQVLDAYDPEDGERLWYLSGLSGNRVIPSPIVKDEWIYANTGFINDPALLAVKINGVGERPQEVIVWKNEEKISDSPSPVVWGDNLFTIDNRGFLQCLNRFDGSLTWSEKLEGFYRASPIVSDGRIYFLNMEGQTTVIEASDSFKILSENQLKDKTLASPAVSEGMIFIRGDKHLYCLSTE